MMNTDAIRKVNEKVYQKYIKLSGKKPKVSKLTSGSYLLLYSFSDELPGGKTLSQTIRVVADENGNVSKISSSRG